jgi:amino-acid N-acetyltransferase
MITATSQHLPAIAELLEACALPIEDLAQQDLSLFLVSEEENHIKAVGGLERFGNVALIRSVATTAVSRGQGLASRLVRQLEDMARSKGITTLYLLTETATGYFESLGYASCSRDSAPPVIKTSNQFSSLCPNSATLMVKQLARK